jgi:hypothetical protein
VRYDQPESLAVFRWAIKTFFAQLRASPRPLGSKQGEQRDDRKRRSGKADILDAGRNSI